MELIINQGKYSFSELIKLIELKIKITQPKEEEENKTIKAIENYILNNHLDIHTNIQVKNDYHVVNSFMNWIAMRNGLIEFNAYVQFVKSEAAKMTNLDSFEKNVWISLCIFNYYDEQNKLEEALSCLV